MTDVRPIDANVLLTKTHNYYPSTDHYCLSRHAVDVKDVVDAPTLDYAPIRHGEWIKITDRFGYPIGMNCSECGRRVRNCGENYCPKCGARMDLKEE